MKTKTALKRLAIVAGMIGLALAGGTSTVSAAGCGLEPIGIPPLTIGCTGTMVHRCVCTNGGCFWAWVCV